LRTLVISDLHLGNRAGNDVLRRPAPLDSLLDALDGIDRLVLLGDLAELMTRNRRRPLAVAEPVLRAIGRRLGSDREVLIVPGNHDAPLIRSWASNQGRQLAIDSVVPPDASAALARVISWLAPARVTVRYPGVWLEERIWATHGHYLDSHLFPESSFGMLRGNGHRPSGDHARPIDYERIRRRHRPGGDSFAARLVERPVPALLGGGAWVVRTKMVPVVPRFLMNARLAPLTASLVDLQMQRAGIPALSRVVRRLGVDADWVVFGHLHRTGPLAGEPDDRWHGDDGSPRYVNPGSWLYEPLLVDRSSPPHPYWPGGAVLIESGSEPTVVGLLDGLTVGDIGPRRPR
jgi:predicted phosphodiesterase